jgi:hypothetical protein
MSADAVRFMSGYPSITIRNCDGRREDELDVNSVKCLIINIANFHDFYA